MDERTGYWIALSRARIGWNVQVTDYGEGHIGIAGSIVWRPTRQGALRSALRYVRRRREREVVEEFPADDVVTIWVGA